jgi:small subunit ribosomal protein S6
MAQYELMVLVDSQNVEVAKVQEGIKKLVEKHQGKITATDDWGERALAYPIKGLDRGYYIVLKIECLPKVVKKLTTQLRMETGILRILMTKNERIT